MKFKDAEWTIDGMTEKGVYPIVVKPEYWYVDHYKKKPTQRVRRYQLPIAPDFSRTLYTNLPVLYTSLCVYMPKVQ